MEADVLNLGKEVERLDRQAVVDLELSKPTSTAIRNNPNANMDDEKVGRAPKDYKKAFWNSMRNKDSYDIQNALKIGTDSEGGYLVPDEFERTLVEGLLEENIFRQLAKVITTSSGDRKFQ